MSLFKQKTSFVGHNVEVTYIEDKFGVVWFLANTFLSCLGYDAHNWSQTTKKNVQSINIRAYKDIEVAESKPSPTFLIQLSSKFINEAGINDLITNCKNPRALEFRQWVNGQVLPTLRRNGKYSMLQAPKLHQAQMSALSCIFGKVNTTSNNSEQVDSTKKCLELQLQLKDHQLQLAQKDTHLANKDATIQLAKKDVDIMREKMLRLEAERENEKILLMIAAGKEISSYKDFERQVVQFHDRLEGRVIRAPPRNKRQILTLYLIEEEQTTYAHVFRGQINTSITPLYRKSILIEKFECAHSIGLWNKCKESNFDFFYGVEFRPGSPNTFWCLTKIQLLKKYQTDLINNRKKILKKIPNETTLMTYSFIRPEQLIIRTQDIIYRELLAEKMELHQAVFRRSPSEFNVQDGFNAVSDIWKRLSTTVPSTLALSAANDQQLMNN